VDGVDGSPFEPESVPISPRQPGRSAALAAPHVQSIAATRAIRIVAILT
jgi:hypothetical protein